MHCTPAVRTSGMHCTSIRIFWYAPHFRVTSVVVQLLVVRHRHSQLAATQLLVVCCTGRVSLGHIWHALHFSCEDVWYALHFDQDLLVCTALQGHFSGCTATSSTPPALSTISYTATSSVLYRTSVVRSYLACTALRPGSSGMHFRVTSVVVQLLVVHHRHSQLSVTQLLVVCCTGRVSSGPSSLASAYRLSNTPLPLVVWAICAALSAVAILQRWS